MIDAAYASGAKRVIWSGLQSIKEPSGGKYKNIDHFESKWQVTLYGRKRFRGTGVAFINVDAGAYASNFTNEMRALFAPQPKGDGTYVLKSPVSANVKMPIIDMENDYGLFVRHAIESNEYAQGGEILTASEMITLSDLVRQLSDGVYFKQLY